MKAERQLDGRNRRGKREMHALAVSAFSALERADLTDVLDLLQERVLDRSPDHLIEVELVDGVYQWRFKPLVELMLRHTADTASNPTLSLDARREEIRGVLDMLGF